MKHLLIAAILLAVSVGGFVLTRGGSGSGDVLAERDAFFGGSFVVAYEAGPPSPRTLEGTQPWEAYRMTWVDEEAWQFEGTTVPGEAGPHLVHNQHGALADYDEGCFDSYPQDRMLDELAEVPGLTYATEVLSGIDVARDGDHIAYTIPRNEETVLAVREDLSGLDEGSIVAAVRLADTEALVGTYRFTRLDGAALVEARAAIEGIAPTEQVLLQARWRPLDGRFDSEVVETERPILRDCPQLLGFGPDLDLRPLGDGTWVLEDGLAIDVAIDAPRDELISAAIDTERADVPIRPGTVIIEPFEMVVGIEGGSTVYGAFALEIIGCGETDWFRCEPG